jgi:hypothetical protein
VGWVQADVVPATGPWSLRRIEIVWSYYLSPAISIMRRSS